jgi:hypothetical protein
MRVTQRPMALALAAALIVAGYVVRFDGDPRPVDPLLVTVLHEGPQWYSKPALFPHAQERSAIYAVPGFTGPDGSFEAVRVDVTSGARYPARVVLGPTTHFIPFDAAETVGVPAVELRGLSVPRPTFHFFTLPGDGRGPGFHRVESATGVVRVVAGPAGARRTLLTRAVLDSSRMPEMASLVAIDRARRLATFLWQRPQGWTLYVFSLAELAA